MRETVESPGSLTSFTQSRNLDIEGISTRREYEAALATYRHALAEILGKTLEELHIGHKTNNTNGQPQHKENR